MAGNASSASLIAAAALVGLSIWLWTRRRPPLPGPCQDEPCEVETAAQGTTAQCDDDAVSDIGPLGSRVPQPPPEPPKPPMKGFLVAGVQAPEGFGGYIPEEGDGPPSTDSEDDDVVRDVTSWSSVGAKKAPREASFRQRSSEKAARASVLQANSKELTSHLVTPAQHNRRLELLGTPKPTAPNTVSGTRRTLPDRGDAIKTKDEGDASASFKRMKPNRGRKADTMRRFDALATR